MKKIKDDEIQISDIPESYQKYLDEIYVISQKNRGGWVTNKEIADSLKIEPASISGMLHKLKNKNLINWKPRKAIRLTEKGKIIAKKLNETHSLLRVFFEKILKIEDQNVVEKISCGIEHHITNDVKEALKTFLLKYEEKK